MSVLKFAGGAIAALALAVAAPAAQAATFTATFLGHVASGVDGAGDFGSSGVDLSGEEFTAVLTYRTRASAYYSIPGVEEGYRGGATFGTPSIISADLMIASESLSFSGLESGGVARSLINNQFTALVQSGPESDTLVFAFQGILDVPPTLDAPFSGNVSAPGFFHKFARIEGGEFITSLDLSVDTVSVASVPEPGAWSLMILGFGGVGAAMRTRRRVAAAA